MFQKIENRNIISIFKNNKSIKKCIKNCMHNDEFQMIIPNLNNNSFIVAHTSEDGRWESFLHCCVNNDTLTFATGYTKKENRRQGLSTKLRLYILNNYKHIRQFESLTMPDSKSNILLEKIGFTKEGNKMIKRI